MKILTLLVTDGANYDAKTGIVFGFHYPRSAPYIHETMMSHGEDISYREARQEIIDNLNAAIEPYFQEIGAPNADNAAEQIFDDFINEYLEIDSDHWVLDDEEKGLKLELTEDSLVVLKSPVVAWVAECSPCAPNGGDLETPRGSGEQGTWAYCLPEDFFDEGESPYGITMTVGDLAKLQALSGEKAVITSLQKVLNHEASEDEVDTLKKKIRGKGLSYDDHIAMLVAGASKS